MKRSIRRFLIMLVAWPFGIVCAVAWLFVPMPWSSPCPAGRACALERTSLVEIVAWLCVARGPGIVATARWWRGDDPPAP